jgi:hypothetical protein
MARVAGVLMALLAGSGSTLFAVLSEDAGDAARRTLRALAATDGAPWRALETVTAERVAGIELID